MAAAVRQQQCGSSMGSCPPSSHGWPAPAPVKLGVQVHIGYGAQRGARRSVLLVLALVRHRHADAAGGGWWWRAGGGGAVDGQACQRRAPTLPCGKRGRARRQRGGAAASAPRTRRHGQTPGPARRTPPAPAAGEGGASGEEKRGGGWREWRAAASGRGWHSPHSLRVHPRPPATPATPSRPPQAAGGASEARGARALPCSSRAPELAVSPRRRHAPMPARAAPRAALAPRAPRLELRRERDSMVCRSGLWATAWVSGRLLACRAWCAGTGGVRSGAGGALGGCRAGADAGAPAAAQTRLPLSRPTSSTSLRRRVTVFH